MQAKTANSLYSLRFPPWTSRKSLKYKFFNMHMNSMCSFLCSAISLSHTHSAERRRNRLGIWIFDFMRLLISILSLYTFVSLTAFTLLRHFSFTFTATRIFVLFIIYFSIFSPVKQWIWCGIDIKRRPFSCAFFPASSA